LWRRINVEPGQIREKSEHKYLKNATKLRIFGTIDEDDFSYIRDLKKIKNLDLSQVNHLGFDDSEIPLGAFDNCTNLETIILPKSTEYIRPLAFNNCCNLNKIILPESLIMIQGGAFSGCDNLLNVNLSESVHFIGDFRGFNGKITVDINNPKFSSIDGVLLNKEQNVLLHAPSNISKYEVPSTVRRIEKYAFPSNVNIDTLIVPQSVIEINSERSSHQSILHGFSGYVIVDSLNPVFSSVDGALINKQNKCLLYYPKSATEPVVVPAFIKKISYKAFNNCKLITKVFLPNSIVEIDTAAFSFCENLKSINIPEGILKIGTSAFRNCLTLDSIIIPKTINKIEEEAFLSCKNLTYIDIPITITEIGESAFEDCKSLQALNLPDSLFLIGRQAFKGCDKLKSLIIPASCERIANNAFNLSSVEFHVDENNPHFTSKDGVLFNKDKSVLIQYPINKEGYYHIPTSVKKINDLAFLGCSKISILNIPNSVLEIGDISSMQGEIIVDANNQRFKNIEGALIDKIDEKLIFIPKSKKGKYIVPDSLKIIGCKAFFNCNELDTIVIPASVNKMGFRAFYGCVNLRKVIKYGSTDPSFFDDCFDDNKPILVAEKTNDWRMIKGRYFYRIVRMKQIGWNDKIEIIEE